MKMKRLAALIAAMLVSTCMAASVSAADFTPSVVGKDAPTVSTVVTQDGKEAAAIVYDKDGNEVGSVAVGSLVVTPVSKATEAASPEAAARLAEAYKQVQAAKTLTDLAPEVGTVLMQLPGNVSADKMVVRDLFDVSVDADTQALLDAGNTVTVTMQANIAEGKPLVVLQFVDGVWTVIDPAYVVINADGTVFITLASVGTLAFATESDTTNASADGVAYLFPSDNDGGISYTVSTSAESAQKDNAQWPYLLGAGAAVLVAAGAASALLMKKDN